MGKLIRLLLVFLFVAAACFFPRLSFAQNHLLKGNVRDTLGKPLPGVSVKIKGENVGTITGNDGNFTITLPAHEGVLEISLVGFEKKVVTIKEQTTIVIILNELKSELKDVVVVGYGTLKKSDITGAISSIKNKDFRDQPVSN